MQMAAPARPVRRSTWGRRVLLFALAAIAALAVRLSRTATGRTASVGGIDHKVPRSRSPASASPPARGPADVTAHAHSEAVPLAGAIPGSTGPTIPLHLHHVGAMPGEAHLEVPVGADRTTGLIPDHGSRHLPRTLWLATYAAAIVGPFILILVRDDAPHRSFILEIGSALGIAALSLLALQLALPARLPLLADLGAEVAVRLHRRLADIMLAVVAAHVAAVMVADPARLQLLTVFGEPWRAQAAMGSVVALAVLSATSILRRRLRLPYVGWRLIHLVAGGLALVLAVVHTIGVGRYLVRGPAEFALVALTVAGLGALVLMRSRWFRRGSVRPYWVDRVVSEKGGAITLELRADGHTGQRFIPGQFAWLKLAGARALLAEHPFSYSSSAEAPERPQFTMKTQSGFTASAAEFEPGTRLFVDGPHGAFRPRAISTGTLLIAGGIGITPSMSILRTAADRGDHRPYLLVYGTRTLESATFLAELEQLRGRLRLTIVLVLSAPQPDWTGERGRINAGVLDRHLPRDVRGWEFMICGAGPFVDGAIEALEAVGIHGERVHAERFVEV